MADISDLLNNDSMLDLSKALNRLKGELAGVNRAMGVFESMAADRYQRRRKRALQESKVCTSATRLENRKQSFVPPARLDPDVMLWR